MTSKILEVSGKPAQMGSRVAWGAFDWAPWPVGCASVGVGGGGGGDGVSAATAVVMVTIVVMVWFTGGINSASA